MLKIERNVLNEIEVLCQDLYNPQSQQQRHTAESRLLVFTSSSEYAGHCKDILEATGSSYAQLFACTSLMKIATDHTLSLQFRKDLHKYLMEYLQSNGVRLEQYVTTQLVALIARLTKLSWYDDQQFRHVVQEAERMIVNGTKESCYFAFKLLTVLVQEMNQPTPQRSLNQHRKTAISFRDLSLLQVLKVALGMLHELKQNSQERLLTQQALQLTLSCLSFDFVGTCIDESCEELGTIQVPAPWREIIESPPTVHVFLDIYNQTEAPLSHQALECLVRLASVRRSLFGSEAERNKFLARLVSSSLNILQSKRGLQEDSNYHEFCRLLGRVKSNYQLGELVSLEDYPAWIHAVANFTVQSLNASTTNNSLYYLLGLWARLVTSLPYYKGQAAPLLDQYVPQITKQYIDSKLLSVQGNDEEAAPHEQLDNLPSICRFKYDIIGAYVLEKIDSLLHAFSQQQQNGLNAQESRIVEGQLTWLIYIIGMIIRGKLSSGAADSQEQTDGELCARVFRLLQVCDSQSNNNAIYVKHARQQLDIAILDFFENFRRVYVGDQAMYSSKVYKRLGELVGYYNHQIVLNAILQKLATNLKVYASCEALIDKTLNLFQELSSGYMSSKLLNRLEVVNHMVTHHSTSYFAFLNNPANLRNRTVYYATLSKLVFMQDSLHKTKSFLAPIGPISGMAGVQSPALANELQALTLGGGSSLEQQPTGPESTVLYQLFTAHQVSEATSNPSYLTTTIPLLTLIGLFRDLRGIVSSASTKQSYNLVLDWLYPKYFPAFLACFRIHGADPKFSVPFLKFISELVYNKQTRLVFDSFSPNAVLLFREASKVLVVFGDVLAGLGEVSDVYGCKYKGIWICMQIMTRALGGNYVTFGVFDLYNDTCLKDALSVLMRMVLSIPLPDILGYQKLSRAYYGFIEVLCTSQPHLVASFNYTDFAYVAQSLEAGLRRYDVTISSQCAAAIDKLAGFYFRNVTQITTETPHPAASVLQSHLEKSPKLFTDLLWSLFQIILFEECGNIWSLSRPLLTLVLVGENYYEVMKDQLTLQCIDPDRQSILKQQLDSLMKDVQRNLDPKNRDKFTQNLSGIRQEFRSRT